MPLQLIFLSAETEVLDAAMGYHQDVARLLQGRFQVLESVTFRSMSLRRLSRCAVIDASRAEAHPGRVQWHVKV
jgi:hypothetical protein